MKESHRQILSVYCAVVLCTSCE